jgi:hypothetical protein
LDPLIRVRLEVDGAGREQESQPSGDSTPARRISPRATGRERKVLEAKQRKRESLLRPDRASAAGRRKQAEELQQDRATFVSPRLKHADKFVARARQRVEQVRAINGPFRPEEARAHKARVEKLQQDASRAERLARDRVRHAMPILQSDRSIRVEKLRALRQQAADRAKRAQRFAVVQREGGKIAGLARGGIGGALRSGMGAAARVAGPVAAAYLGARTIANALPGATAFAGLDPVRGPSREFASLEAGVTSYIGSFDDAYRRRQSALLLGGDLGGDAYALPFRSETTSVDLKQKEFAAYLERERSVRRNAAAGDLWREALFGERSLIGQLFEAKRSGGQP